MPEHPFIYGADAPPPVAPGGTRIRLHRRRSRQEEEGEDHRDPGQEEAAWRALLQEAVEDLNNSFRRSSIPFSCALEEDDRGLSLHIRRAGETGPGEDVEEEMEPADLPQWLARLRSRLGLLVDETA